MSTYFVAAFLILYGVKELFSTTLPNWAVGVVAFGAALAILLDKHWKHEN